MVGTREVFLVALATISCGCTSLPAESSIDAGFAVAPRAMPSAIEPHPEPVAPPAREWPVTFRSFDAPGPLEDRLDARGATEQPRAGFSDIDVPVLAAHAVASLGAPQVGCALLRLGHIFELEFCAGSEPQELDTAGYWEEFHLGRTQDQRLDLTWRWQQARGAALTGSLGSPRRLDQELDEAIFDADEVFVAVGLFLSW